MPQSGCRLTEIFLHISRRVCKDVSRSLSRRLAVYMRSRYLHPAEFILQMALRWARRGLAELAVLAGRVVAVLAYPGVHARRRVETCWRRTRTPPLFSAEDADPATLLSGGRGPRHPSQRRTRTPPLVSQQVQLAASSNPPFTWLAGVLYSTGLCSRVQTGRNLQLCGVLVQPHHPHNGLDGPRAPQLALPERRGERGD